MGTGGRSDGGQTSTRLPLWRPGAIEVLLVVVLIGAVFLPTRLVTGNTTGRAFEDQAQAIDDAEASGPVTPASTWSVTDLGFAKAEVPGAIRKVEMDTTDSSGPSSAPSMDAVVIGGHESVVVIVKLPTDGKAPLLQAQVDALSSLHRVVGSTDRYTSYQDIVDFHPKPGSSYTSNDVIQLGVALDHDLSTGEYALLGESSYDGQTLRVRAAMVGKQPILVASLSPEGSPAPDLDRIVRSLKAS